MRRRGQGSEEVDSKADTCRLKADNFIEQGYTGTRRVTADRPTMNYMARGDRPGPRRRPLASPARFQAPLPRSDRGYGLYCAPVLIEPRATLGPFTSGTVGGS